MNKKITKLIFQKNSRNRVNIFIDDKYSFSLSLEVASTLKKGDSISVDEIKEFQKKDLFFKAYEVGLKYIETRARSEKEVEEYLKKKGYDKNLIKEVVQKKLKRYLNDEFFAEMFIENRVRFNPKGKYALSYELKKKGIEETIIDKALHNIDNKENALRAIKKNQFRWKKQKGEALKKRLFSFLQRRGFDFDTIYNVLEDLKCTH